MYAYKKRCVCLFMCFKFAFIVYRRAKHLKMLYTTSESRRAVKVFTRSLHEPHWRARESINTTSTSSSLFSNSYSIHAVRRESIQYTYIIYIYLVEDTPSVYVCCCFRVSVFELRVFCSQMKMFCRERGMECAGG